MNVTVDNRVYYIGYELRIILGNIKTKLRFCDFNKWMYYVDKAIEDYLI